MLGVLASILVIFTILMVNSVLDKRHQMSQTAKLYLIRVLGYVILALSGAGVAPAL